MYVSERKKERYSVVTVWLRHRLHNFYTGKIIFQALGVGINYSDLRHRSPFASPIWVTGLPGTVPICVADLGYRLDESRVEKEQVCD